MDVDAATVPLEELDRLWDFDDPAGSEQRFLALLPRARHERDGAFLGEVLTQLARAQGLQRRFGEADRTLDEAASALRPDDERGRVRLLLERGRVANSAGRAGRGAAQFADAWERARAEGEDALAVDAAHMLGIVEPPESAREWNERAMQLARTSPDPRARRWVGSLASNMGWARHEAGDYDQALAHRGPVARRSEHPPRARPRSGLGVPRREGADEAAIASPSLCKNSRKTMKLRYFYVALHVRLQSDTSSPPARR